MGKDHKRDPGSFHFCFPAEDSKAFVEAIKRAANEVITAEPEITRQDQIAGDGDAGLTLKAGAEGDLPSGHSESSTCRILMNVCERGAQGNFGRRINWRQRDLVRYDPCASG